MLANKRLGYDFVNKESSTRKFHFFATGNWTYNPKEDFNRPNGNKKYPQASENYNLPGSPEGALIVSQKGKYHFIGDDKILILDPNEKVKFTINDTGDSNNGDAFNDNQGSLTVEWTCEDCK